MVKLKQHNQRPEPFSLPKTLFLDPSIKNHSSICSSYCKRPYNREILPLSSFWMAPFIKEEAIWRKELWFDTVSHYWKSFSTPFLTWASTPYLRMFFAHRLCSRLLLQIKGSPSRPHHGEISEIVWSPISSRVILMKLVN